ncbi:HD domain-containing protein [Congregibacter litoralis]|uniref:Guanosine polyphosphate pyrophosphohydrolase/synthetase n=1 Tax=Congregibacter litoralis KT71 TaxID=314285 RepID=A4A4K9_9GAMM|nr:HD domain-containing protein [Congregibacter litoralis]EAQ98730.1 Guanosine polyphosphate pyrophosphohydrolase/synthetase [Congregibacter litoralis KT71]
MIKVERTEYGFGTFNCSLEEWEAIKTIVRYCANNYRATELIYSIPGPEEHRRGKVEDLSEIMDHLWDSPPIETMPRDQIFLINQCVIEFDGKDVPDIDQNIVAGLAQQLHDLGVYDVFDDDNVTDEQWEEWAKEGRLQKTSSWVCKLHDGQVDKAGRPYAEHVLRVYERVRETFPDANEDALHAALLHDVIEDCDITSDDLRKHHYSEDTIKIVEAVTKSADDGLTYAERIESLAERGPLGAVQVKLCDLMDNSDPERLKALPEEKAASLSKRYSRAIEVLKTRLEQAN